MIDAFIRQNNGYVTLYPNPATNILNLEANQPIKSITFFDVSGRTVQEISVFGSKKQTGNFY